MKNRRNIIIAPGKGMGNFISMIGCFKTISQNINEKVTILTKKSTSAKMYLSNQNFCEEIIYIDENKRGIINIFYNFKLFFKLVFLLKSLNIHKLYILHPSKKYIFVSLFAGINKIYAPGYRFQNFFLPKANKYYKSFFSKPLDPLIETQELIKKIFKIRILDQGLVTFEKKEKNYIGICIACSGYERQWGIQNYLKVINYLIIRGYKKFIILSGRNQNELENELISKVEQNNQNILLLKTSEKQMIDVYEILKEVFLYIGNDTGIAHLSLALGIKSIIIHGDCPPQNYSNLNNVVDNIENKEDRRSKTSIKKITFDKVKNTIDKVLNL